MQLTADWRPILKISYDFHLLISKNIKSKKNRAQYYEILSSISSENHFILFEHSCFVTITQVALLSIINTIKRNGIQKYIHRQNDMRVMVMSDLELYNSNAIRFQSSVCLFLFIQHERKRWFCLVLKQNLWFRLSIFFFFCNFQYKVGSNYTL